MQLSVWLTFKTLQIFTWKWDLRSQKPPIRSSCSRCNLIKSLIWTTRLWFLQKLSIGHLKREHGMGRNMLKGELGDQMNALLSASGMNIAKILSYIRVYALYLYFFVVFRREIIKRKSLQAIWVQFIRIKISN